MSTAQPHWRHTFEVGATIAMIVLAVIVVFRTSAGSRPAVGRRTVPLPQEPVSVTLRPTLGSHDAQVALIEYSDFQCPFCGSMAREIWPPLREEYVNTGKVQLVFKHLPLQIHDLAEGAAVATECAWRQGRFWEMHDELFVEFANLSHDGLSMAGVEMGLDLEPYAACRAGTDAATSVSTDVAEARALGISGTPTFLIGRFEANGEVRVERVIEGIVPLADFRAALEAVLR